MISRPMRILCKINAPIIGLALFTAHSGSIANQVYHWVDESGKTHYSQRPPMGTQSERIEVKNKASSDAEDARKKLQETRKTLLEQKQKNKPAEQQQPKHPRASKEACDKTHKNLEILTSGKRVKQTGENGEQNYLNEEQITDNISKNQEFLKNHCGNQSE